MSAGERLAAAIHRASHPARATVLVVPAPLLRAAREPSAAGGVVFGTRERRSELSILRAESLEPTDRLVRLGVVDGGSAEALPGDVRLLPAEPAQATLDGAPVEIVVNDASRYRDRIVALPGAPALAGKTVLLVGLGSVGSALGASLVRLGVRTVGCDPDLLVVENLVRWGLPARLDTEVGRPKCDVWAELLDATVPDAKVEGHLLDVVRQEAAFDALVSRTRPDLLVAATDTRDSRRAVNAAAAHHGVPALFVALSDAAASVRVELVADARRGPCHLCAMLGEGITGALADGARGSRTPYAAEASPPEAVAVPALPVDIALGTAVATRLAVLLLAGQPLREYLRHGEQEGNVLFFSLRPAFWIFEEAWDRLVYQVERSPDCPVCGRAEDGDEL